MFLESITAQGFNGISATLERKFDCQQNVNNGPIEIGVPALITAFSIIFDPKFMGNKLAELVDIQGPNSFVEVVLWQSETYDEFNWLKKNRLKIHRNLKDKPDKISVNGKLTDIRSFHKGLASYGYISIDNFHLHRLLDNEIGQIEDFTGDDLWNLILRVNDCSDLVHHIEARHKNRKMMHNELAATMKSMEDVLPSKLKLRNNIKSHIQLSRQFNSLMTIVNRRKSKLLIKNKEAIMPDVSRLTAELNETALAVLEGRVKEAMSKNQTKYYQKLESLMSNEKVNLYSVVNEPADDPSEPLMEVQENFASNVTNAIDFLEEAQKVFANVEDFSAITLSKSFAQLEAVKLRLRLKRLQNEGDLEVMRNLWNLTQTSTNKNIQSCKRELNELTNRIEKNKAVALKALEFSEDQFKKNLQELNSSVSNLKNMITKVSMEIYTNQKPVIEFQSDIDELTIKGQLDVTFIKTLQAIEKFVLSLDAGLSADYLGPVFQHLNSVPDLDDKIWPLIASKAQIFLFLRGSSARAANKMLVESGVSTGPYVFMGLDEFSSNNLTAIEEELKDQVKPASLLVKSDVRFAKLLKKLLGDVVLADNKGIVGQLPKDRVVASFSDTNVISKSNECFTITSVSQKLPDMQDYSAIDFLQNVYANVKQQAALLMKIERAKASREELESFLKNATERVERACSEECKTVNKAVVALRELPKLLKDRNQVQGMFYNEEAMRLELINFGDLDPASWNEDELKEAERTLEDNFSAHEKLLIRLKNPLRLTFAKFDGVMHGIETGQLELTGLLTKMIRFASFCKETKARVEILLEQIGKELDEVSEKILQDESSPPFDDTEMRLKLNDIRCQLYERNSQLHVIDYALSTCQDTDEVIDQPFYDEFKRKSGEAIAQELSEIRRGLEQHAQSVDLETINLEKYGHLFETIKKVKKYSESPPRMMTRSKVTAKAFPLANQLVVQILKDVVFNFEISFNYLLADFNQKSSLYFYTVGMFEPIQKDDLSWACFDLQRLKAMEFSTVWTEQKVSATSLKRLKALLLILHIISSMSIFKFVIIDEKFFDNMEETLEKNIRKFLGTLSAFVQVILYKSPPEVEEMECDSDELTI